MKKVFSSTKTAIILLLVTVLFLGLYAYMIARPVSYGMSYHNEIVYEGESFEGTLTFYRNGKVLNENSNFDEPFEMYYYYKDGYVFNMMAKTDEEYEAEVAYINDNFDNAVASPFYASSINAFKQVAVGMDEDVTTYTCTGAVVFAIAGGVGALALIALTTASFVLSKKAKNKE